MWCIYQAINIIINLFTIGPPLDVMARMVGFFNEDNMAGVRINWTHNDGNYDRSHFTVQVFEKPKSESSSSLLNLLEKKFGAFNHPEVSLGHYNRAAAQNRQLHL